MMMWFGPSELHRPIAQLKRLKEGNNFIEYVEAFVALISKVELSDEDQVSMFIKVLKPNNQKLIKVLGPRNLPQVIAFAKTLSSEGDPYRIKRPEQWGRIYSGQSQRNGQPLTMQQFQTEKSMVPRVQNTCKPFSVPNNRSVPY